jgi:uncharacterized membrane protein YqjE
VFLIIALVLFVVWVIGFAFFRAMAGGLVHLILVVAIIALVWHLVSRHSTGPGSGTNVTGISLSDRPDSRNF